MKSRLFCFGFYLNFFRMFSEIFLTFVMLFLAFIKYCEINLFFESLTESLRVSAK